MCARVRVCVFTFFLLIGVVFILVPIPCNLQFCLIKFANFPLHLSEMNCNIMVHKMLLRSPFNCT